MVRFPKNYNQFLCFLEKELNLKPADICEALGWTRQRYYYCKANNVLTHENLLTIIETFELTPFEIGCILTQELEARK